MKATRNFRLVAFLLLAVSPLGSGAEEHSSAMYRPVNLITVNGCAKETDGRYDIAQEIREIKYLVEALKSALEGSTSAIDDSLLQDIKGWWIAMMTSMSEEHESGLPIASAQEWWDTMISAVTTTPSINGPPLGTIQDWFIAVMTTMMESSFAEDGLSLDQIREWWMATLMPLMDSSDEDEGPLVQHIQDWFISLVTPIMETSKDKDGSPLQVIQEWWNSAITSFAESNTADLPAARDCYELKQRDVDTNGVYSIQPDGSEPFDVYCDMTIDGGGWTVFQRREDGSVDFSRTWSDYKSGFGSPEGEFWLGNDKLYYLSNQKTYELRVDLEDFDDNHRYALYDSFEIEDESDKYRLHLGSYSGDAGDAMTYHNNEQFTTSDQDNDESPHNCAVRYKGGWWYNMCHHANLNGLYLEGHHAATAEGVNWLQWRGHYYSLKFTELKLRPVSD